MSTIIGNTTAIPNLRPDWNQTDETKADYIKNKPTVDQSYTPVSTNAQSGVAVANALVQFEAELANTSPEILTTMQNLSNLLTDDISLSDVMTVLSHKANAVDLEDKINVIEHLTLPGYVRYDGAIKAPTGLYRTTFFPVYAGETFIYSLKGYYYEANPTNPVIAWSSTGIDNTSSITGLNKNYSVPQNVDEIITGEYTVPADGFVMVCNDMNDNPNPEFYRNNLSARVADKADKTDIDKITKTLDTIINIDELLNITGRVAYNGTISESDSFLRSNYIPVNAGDTFIYSLQTINDGSPVIAWYGSNVLASTYNGNNSVCQLSDEVRTGEYVVPEDGYIIVSNYKTNPNPKFYRKNVIGELDSNLDNLTLRVDDVSNKVESFRQLEREIGNFDYFFKNATNEMLFRYGTEFGSAVPTENIYLSTPYIRVYAGDILYYNLLGTREYSVNRITSLLTIYDLDKLPIDVVQPEEYGVVRQGSYIFEVDGYVRLCNNMSHNGEAYFENSLEYIIKNSETPTQPSTSIKWCAMGDSITQGYWSSYLTIADDYSTETEEITSNSYYSKTGNLGWVSHVAKLNNYELTNEGIGGSGWLFDRPDNPVLNAKQLVDSGNIDFAQFDLVTLAYGVNDWKGNSVLGAITDDKNSGNSIYANMKYVIEKINEINPKCKIIVISPFNCRPYGDFETNYALGYSFDNNGTLADIFEAEKEVCQYYGIEFIDMTYSSIINRCNMQTLLPDSVHPSKSAHKILGRELSKKINY